MQGKCLFQDILRPASVGLSETSNKSVLVMLLLCSANGRVRLNFTPNTVIISRQQKERVHCNTHSKHSYPVFSGVYEQKFRA